MLLLRETNNINGARTHFEQAQEGLEFVSAKRPNDIDLALDVADGYGWLADVERVSGSYVQALAYRIRQQQRLARLSNREPRDTRIKVELLAALLGTARVNSEGGDFQRADEGLRQAQQIADDLVVNDPENVKLATQQRGAEVFRARNWLLMPKGHRPSYEAIARLNGDCEVDWQRPAFHELAALCMILQARLRRLAGETEVAQVLFRDHRVQNLLTSGRLTKQWKVNLRREIERI